MWNNKCAPLIAAPSESEIRPLTVPESSASAARPYSIRTSAISKHLIILDCITLSFSEAPRQNLPRLGFVQGTPSIRFETGDRAELMPKLMQKDERAKLALRPIQPEWAWFAWRGREVHVWAVRVDEDSARVYGRSAGCRIIQIQEAICRSIQSLRTLSTVERTAALFLQCLLCSVYSLLKWATIL